MATKPFSRELYDKHNGRAILAAINFLKSYGYTLCDTIESYKSHDIRMMKDREVVLIEVEVCEIWKSKDGWQGWLTNRTPGRKSESRAKLMLRFNNSLSCVAVAPMAIIHSSPLNPKDTKYTTQELFYDTPWFCYDYFVNNEPTDENRFL